MEKEKIQELILKFNKGEASKDEVSQIERLIENGVIFLEELQDINLLENRLSKLGFPSPSPDLDDRFYQMLASEKKAKAGFSWKEFFSWPQFAPRLVLATLMLIIGVAVGYFIKPSSENPEMASVTSELKQLREMMMLSLLEKESATERLKAVSLTSNMDEASTRVTQALIRTLNEDTNVNVRLAALEALKPYTQNGEVRQALIQSISKQQSPLVQVALAELMEALQLKSSVKELEKIIESEKTPPDVRKRIKQTIDVLI